MHGKPLLDVLAGRKPSRRPMWFMRQAGRYLPEYRQVREQAGSFLSLCYSPELAAEVTLQPLRRFDLDAAILFADILVVPDAMGLSLDFTEGEGPRLETVRDLRDVERLCEIRRSDKAKRVCETVGRVRSDLPEKVGLIGFCGGPWTVASYMVEGGSSDRRLAKLAAFGRESWFRALIDRLVSASIDYLAMQIEAGAEAVQIFDSWAGDLPEGVREEFVVGPLAQVVDGVRRLHPGTPVIVFGRGLGVDHLEVMVSCRPAALGIETEQSLRWIYDAVGDQCAVQGNLDPVALLGSVEVARAEACRVTSSVPMERHIFNLGHGIRQETRPEVLAEVVAAVRRWDAGKV
jgi:uroporphyrinogen decarboxylase